MKKIITQTELIRLTDTEKIEVMKKICLGETIYIGGNESGKEKDV